MGKLSNIHIKHSGGADARDIFCKGHGQARKTLLIFWKQFRGKLGGRIVMDNTARNGTDMGQVTVQFDAAEQTHVDDLKDVVFAAKFRRLRWEVDPQFLVEWDNVHSAGELVVLDTARFRNNYDSTRGLISPASPFRNDIGTAAIHREILDKKKKEAIWKQLRAAEKMFGKVIYPYQRQHFSYDSKIADSQTAARRRLERLRQGNYVGGAIVEKGKALVNFDEKENTCQENNRNKSECSCFNVLWHVPLEFLRALTVDEQDAMNTTLDRVHGSVLI